VIRTVFVEAIVGDKVQRWLATTGYCKANLENMKVRRE
jgi:hypothetical protein